MIMNNEKLNAGSRKRILIANRGEIAIRVAKAIRELGHIAVGLWTENEQQAVHLEYCHEWVKLNGKSNLETYLNINQLIDLAKTYQIDAIHPGYGFLSENSKFAKKLSENGLIFIGPNPESIEKMGDKGKSKILARKAGVPVVPGSTDEIKAIEEAIKISQEIGFPVLLKAVAGGGGKGMRICGDENELKKNIPTVKREALAAFGYDGVIVEKYILNPRHIEVQILADKKGNVFHVFERECSVQRRHQKILEEAPSPFIGDNEKLRNEICETAVSLAKAINYDSVGTVEFVMGEDKKFYFLEMNTRIQVEHAITEEITGIDLVASMIQIAFNEDFSIKEQSDIKKIGHAIECRICSEDPISMIPAPGIISGFETLFPQGIRFDHCLYKGLEVTPEFDPMVGKLISKGITRKIAIRKMEVALNGLRIEGLKNNIPLLNEILKNKSFIKGDYSTNFLNAEKIVEVFNGVVVNPLTIIEKLAIAEAINMGL